MTTETVTKEHVYALSKESFGIVPGIIKEMAERSVPLSYMYLMGTQTMAKSSLTDLEINAIELKISLLNKCESCVKGHTFLAKKAGLKDEDVAAIYGNANTSIERLNVLLKTAEYIYYSGSDVYPLIVMDYLNDEGVSEQEVFEIIGLISLKVISNYVNNYLASLNQLQRIGIQENQNH